jgi:hypothetical protein
MDLLRDDSIYEFPCHHAYTIHCGYHDHYIVKRELRFGFSDDVCKIVEDNLPYLRVLFISPNRYLKETKAQFESSYQFDALKRTLVFFNIGLRRITRFD